MIIIDLISRRTRVSKRKFVLLGGISGLANAMILAVINVASLYVSDNSGNTHSLYFLSLFLLVILIYGMVQRRLLVEATHHVEEAIHHVRQTLIDNIRRCELATIERIGRERIYTVMSKELQTISQSAQTFVVVIQSSILVFFTALYVAWLSVPAFLIIATGISIGAAIHLMRSKEIRQQLFFAFEKDNALVTKLNDFLDGFKEIKLGRARSDELKQAYGKDSKVVTKTKKDIQTLFATDFVATQLTFYLAIGSIIFIVPMVSHVDPSMVIQITTATLFLIGPITSTVGGLPIFAGANAAAANVMALENELQNVREDKPTSPVMTGFKQITLEKLYFEHCHVEGERAFEVGPINLTIKQGQTIFITGGNGSGKTTFIRLLMGLYPASKGNLLVDGQVIGQNRIDSYRNLFSAVFSDFHLFKSLYGLADYEQATADEWLSFLEIDHKVHLIDNQFTTAELSTGQRKRLALLSGALENRPIYVFDEWAADQDPHFREKFYRQVLPRLKANGQTVLAITHDDKFFDLADVHLQMADGQLREIVHKVPESV